MNTKDLIQSIASKKYSEAKNILFDILEQKKKNCIEQKLSKDSIDIKESARLGKDSWDRVARELLHKYTWWYRWETKRNGASLFFRSLDPDSPNFNKENEVQIEYDSRTNRISYKVLDHVKSRGRTVDSGRFDVKGMSADEIDRALWDRVEDRIDDLDESKLSKNNADLNESIKSNDKRVAAKSLLNSILDAKKAEIVKRKLQESTEKKECPTASLDLELNTKNRNSAIEAEHIQYGPLNIQEPGDYWKDIADFWNTTEKAAQKSICENCAAFDISPRMKDCMPGPISDKDGKFGYCWMHHFKCHSARSCRTWAAGGPIEKNNVSVQWQEKSSN